jgi:small subunit ribosomal protein S21
VIFMTVAVQIRKGETLDKALRRLKKRLDREGIIKEVRDRRYFEKPCAKRRRKEKVAKFTNYLRLRNENM